MAVLRPGHAGSRAWAAQRTAQSILKAPDLVVKKLLPQPQPQALLTGSAVAPSTHLPSGRVCKPAGPCGVLYAPSSRLLLQAQLQAKGSMGADAQASRLRGQGQTELLLLRVLAHT